MTNEEMNSSLAQAKALRNNVAPPGDSMLTRELRAKVAEAVTGMILDPMATSLVVTYYPLERYSAITALPKSEIEKMLGENILAYVTLDNAELRLRLEDDLTIKYLVLFLKLK